MPSRCCLVDEFGEGELRGPIDINVQVQLTFACPHIGDVDLEIADRIRFELLLGRLVALDIRQTGDTMALQAAMQGRSRRVRDRRLQAVEKFVERQQSMPTEGNDDRFLIQRQHRRMQVFRPVGRSAREGRFFHLATVFWLTP